MANDANADAANTSARCPGWQEHFQRHASRDPNGFAHRDWETNPDAGTSVQILKLDKRSDYRFNHLSNGTQACAGKSLAPFIAKAVSHLLVRGRYILRRPKLNMRMALPFQFDDFRARFEYFRPFQSP